MKKNNINILSILFLFISSISYAIPVDSVKNFNVINNSVNKNAMIILGTWAVGNLLIGTYGNFKFNGEKKYFYQFNALWNSVNLILAVNGYLNSIDPNINITFQQSLKDHQNLQNFLALNIGLDLAYTATGFYLKEKSKSSVKNFDILKGYGNSLIIQGLFLFVFDSAFFYTNYHNASMYLYPILDSFNNSVSLNATISF
jgi:hypothetical protein